MMLPKYFNYLNKGTIVSIVGFSIAICAVPFLLFSHSAQQPLVKLTLFALSILCLSGALLLIFSRWIRIDQDGVLSRNLFGMKKVIFWSEMKSVSLVYYSPFPVSSPARYICFSKEQQHYEVITKFSTGNIYMRHRRNLRDLIDTHWNSVKTKKESLGKRMESLFKDLNYKQEIVNNEVTYTCNGKYIKVTFLHAFHSFVIEYADHYSDAIRNLYEDGDLYPLSMEEDELIARMRSDLLSSDLAHAP